MGGGTPLKSWPSFRYYLVENGPDNGVFWTPGGSGTIPTPQEKMAQIRFTVPILAEF